MDNMILKILMKVCLFLFTGCMFVHAVIGASMISGFVKGSLSMGTMLGLIILISRVDQKNKIKKSRKKRQKEQGMKKNP